MRKTPRQTLELRVGKRHTLEVVFYLRRRDIEWFHSRTEHKEEFYHLLSKKVLPVVFEEELQDQDDEPQAGKQQQQQQQSKKRKNKAQDSGKPTTAAATAASRKRKRKSPTPPPIESRSRSREVTHVFGQDIKLTYKSEETEKSDGATLYMTDGEKLDFQLYPKLSKRILCWCFPLNQTDDPTEPDPTDGGFPRPEFIPLADIFRPPTEEYEDSRTTPDEA